MSTSWGSSRLVAAAGLAMLLAATASGRTLRIGILAGADEVVVTAPSGRVLVRGMADDAPSRPADTPLRLGVRGASRAAAPADAATWDVRVTVESSRRKAELVEAALRSALKVPLRIERASGGHAVVAGPFETERRAQGLLGQLRAAGMDEASVQQGGSEPATRPSAGRLAAITGGFEVLALDGERIRLAAMEPTDTLKVGDHAYRGELEVRVDERGRLTVVNEVDLEDYVRGVVPEELGPAVHPAPAALEAQAVAARTYGARTNAHASEGYALCATPHCQVYGGASSEHPLSDAAVAATRSLVLTHAGRLAATYFSSTCGGHTEDVENVFPGDAAPYLRGVPCYPDQVELVRVEGRALEADWQLVGGGSAHEVLALLVATGVVSGEEAREGVFSRRAREDEAREWTRRAAKAAGRVVDPEKVDDVSVDTALSLLRTLGAVFSWSAHGHLVDERDLVAASRFRELQGLEGADLLAALMALKAGVLPEGLEPGWAGARISRGNVLEVLAAWLRQAGAFEMPAARFVSARSGALQVLQGTETSWVALAPDVVLLSSRRGAASRVRDSLELKVGDKLRILRDADGAATFVSVEDDPDGAAFDRMSAYSWWTRRIPLEKLATEAAARAGFEGLRDVRVTEISPAGRVVGLELIGGQGRREIVTGFAVRGILGLPDLRASLVLERDARGRLVAIQATGRGWGHGVGMCQTGAYGMALAGADSDAILAHYYPGTRLQDIARVGEAAAGR